MEVFLCGMDVNSIQRYICKSGKLREIIGASELVAYYSEERPIEILKSLGEYPLREVKPDEFIGVKNSFIVLRAAGGVFRVILQDKSAYDEWAYRLTLEIAEKAPDMEVSIGCVSFDWNEEKALLGANSKLIRLLEKQRCLKTDIVPPPLPPFVANCVLTGRPASEYGDDLNERLSSSCLAKRNMVNNAHKRLKELYSKSLDEDTNNDLERFEYGNYEFAYNFEDMNPNAENVSQSFMAVCCFDGNKIGSVVANLGKDKPKNAEYVEAYHQFSRKLNSATQAALRKATSVTIKKFVINPKSKWNYKLPVRPLVQGGDDLTIVLRGDLGLQFAQKFIQYFGIETKKHFGDSLSAAGGIAMVKASTPFAFAYELAESLLEHAKEHSREKSCIDYQVALGSYYTDIETFRDKEYVMRDNPEYILTQRPYLAEDFEDFIDRTKKLRDEMPRGALKRAAEACHESIGAAKKAYSEIKENLTRRLGGREGRKLMAMDEFNKFYPSSFFSDTQKTTDLLDCLEIMRHLPNEENNA